jgi:hypothetical protein
VGVKKAKGKGKAATKRKAAAKRSSPKSKKGKDIVQVREGIDNKIKDSADLIATKVIEVAKTGQLASARYLFEAVGLYPATEQTAARPIETSLAHTLLTRMGLPLEPVICDEESAPAVSGAEVGPKAVENNSAEKSEGEEESLPDEKRETVQ